MEDIYQIEKIRWEEIKKEIKTETDDAYNEYLRECRHERYIKNKDKYIDYVKKWRVENPEKVREYRRKRKVKRKEYNRMWYVKNKDKRIDAIKKWKAENPEKVREYNRRWRIKNKQKRR